MRLGNPACYECPKDKRTIHVWVRQKDGTAICENCRLILSKKDADDCFEERVA